MALQLLHIPALLLFLCVSPFPALVVNQHESSQPSLKANPLSDDAWQDILARGNSHILMLHSRKRKMTFCMIPKNACTEFLALMMRLDGMSSDHYNPTMHGQQQELIHKDYTRQQLFFHGTSNNRTFGKYWKWAFETPSENKVKAFFYRDPAERLVSAYISKVQTGHYDQFHGLTRSQNPFTPDMSLQDVVDVLETLDMKELEMHVRPQSYICGLEETLEQYTFVGSMKRLQSDANKMVERVGGPTLAHEMLDSGWGQSGTQSLFGVSRSEREGKLGMQTTDAHDQTKNDAQPEALSITRTKSDFFLEHNRAELVAVERELANMDPILKARIEKLYHMDYALIQRAKGLGLTAEE